MGTNYYMIIKSPTIAHTFFATECDYGGKYPEYLEQEYELRDVPDFHYVVHLNKLSYGWRPLFQKHKAFSTFKELEQFYNDYKEFITIEDEYDEQLTFEEYKQEVVEHSEREPEPVKWVYKEDELCGYPGKKYLMTEDCEPEEADLWIPFDHTEYGETQREARRKLEAWDAYVDWRQEYTRDPDYKFDWVEGEFS